MPDRVTFPLDVGDVAPAGYSLAGWQSRTTGALQAVRPVGSDDWVPLYRKNGA